MAAVGDLGNEARGTLRLHTSNAALAMLGESLLAAFLTNHAHVQLDLVVSDAPVDIVAEGFDAGIQLGEVIGVTGIRRSPPRDAARDAHERDA